MKLETLRKRLLEAAIQFGINENALRVERRTERKHRCTEAANDPGTGYFVQICWQDAKLERDEWCDNCRTVMALRETRGTPRRNRQLAKERIIRLTRALQNVEER